MEKKTQPNEITIRFNTEETVRAKNTVDKIQSYNKALETLSQAKDITPETKEGMEGLRKQIAEEGIELANLLGPKILPE